MFDVCLFCTESQEGLHVLQDVVQFSNILKSVSFSIAQANLVFVSNYSRYNILANF